MHSPVRWLALPCIALAFPAFAQQPLPSFAELEAAGAVIGEIRVETHNIFDPRDPRERNIFYRAANTLHVKTKPWLVQRLLLFHSGDRVSARVMEETERLIRQNSAVYDVVIRPTRYEDGVVDVEVDTRDTWTLEPGLKLRRAGGVNSDSFNLKETNLAGTGTTVGIERANSVDRTGTILSLGHDHLFDGWTAASLQHAKFSDGSSSSASLQRPFYALETTWAATATASKFDRTDSLYEAGNVVGQYRHEQTAGELSGGWSPGLVGGWTQRYSGGVNYQSDDYTALPGLAPGLLPPDKTRAGPFVRYQLIQDDFLQVVNRDRIQRPEYLTMGFSYNLQLGRALGAFGSTDQPWLFSNGLSKGFRIAGNSQLLTSASYSAQYGASGGDVQALSTGARYFVPQSASFLLYFASSFDRVKSPNVADDLLLGGDNGLRGYPQRYQRGTYRSLFTAEERYYTDWYPLRLFRVGAAAYCDVGRAWGSEIPNVTNGWLSDCGVGLRVLSARASFGNILHVDFAFPIHRTDPSVKSHQIVVMTATTF
jgi:outer membrane protein assembly factor BamA